MSLTTLLCWSALGSACANTNAVIDASSDSFDVDDADALERDASTDGLRDATPEASWRCERFATPRSDAGRDASDDAALSDAAAPDADSGSAGGVSCNGSPLLCARRFDQVAYATTHNAMSNADERWTIPNQNHGITRQLNGGIRGLMLDTHYYLGRAYLCHGPCELGRKRLAEGLCEITQFLDRNPNEVVSIIFESYVSSADTAQAFAESGLDDYVHTQPPATPWPTLDRMVREQRRMVVFTDRDGGSPAWYHPVWDHAWETHYSFRTPTDFTCTINRGRMGNPLFILNHFLTNPIAMPSFGEVVNRNPLFIDRARQCMTSSGRLPNFVTVDYYDVGDVMAVTRALNGL